MSNPKIHFEITAKDSASAVLGRMEEKFNHLKETAIRFVEAFAVEQLAEKFLGVVESMDQLGKQMQKVGDSSANLQKLGYAAKLADVSTESLFKGVKTLQDNLAKIAGGAGGDAGKVFKALGLSAVDASGKIKLPTQSMIELADKFQHMENGSAKATIAMTLFGKKTGEDLIPLLNDGSKGLTEMGDKFERMGGILSSETIQQATQFSDKLKELESFAGILSQQLAAKLLPYLNDLADRFAAMVENGDLASGLMTGLTDLLNTMSESVLNAYHDWNALGSVWTAIMDTLDAKNPEERYQIWHKAFADIAADASSTATKIADFQARMALLGMPGIGADHGVKKAPGPIIDYGNVAKAQTDKAAAAFAKLKAEAKSLADAARPPLEKLNDTLARIDFLVSHGAMTKFQAGEAIMKAKDDYVHAAGAIANSLQFVEDKTIQLQQINDVFKDSFKSAFQGLISGTESVADAFGNMAKSILNNLATLAANNLFEKLFAPEHALYGGGGGLFSSLLSGIFGGFRAGGGGVSSGSSYIVGERGPELFTPGTSGHITPNGGGGGGGVVYNIDARGADSGRLAVLEQRLMDMGRNMGRNVKVIMAQEKRLQPRTLA